MYLHENILRHEVLNLSSSASGCLQTLSSVMIQNIYVLMNSERSYGTDGKLSNIPLYLCHTDQRKWSTPTRWEECRSKYKIYMHKFNISMSYFLSLCPFLQAIQTYASTNAPHFSITGLTRSSHSLPLYFPRSGLWNEKISLCI